jgi:hypothetical protein
VDESMRRACENKLPTAEKWFSAIKKKAVIPIELEKDKIITVAGGIRFKGKFDKIEFEDEKNNLIRIIDYKTGKPDEHLKAIDNIKSLKDEKCDDYLRQLVSYKILYENDKYEPSINKVSHGVLVFVEPVKKTVRKYNLTEGEFIDKKVEITDAWTRINNLEFDKFEEYDRRACENCDFTSLCWHS